MFISLQISNQKKITQVQNGNDQQQKNNTKPRATGKTNKRNILKNNSQSETNQIARHEPNRTDRPNHTTTTTKKQTKAAKPMPQTKRSMQKNYKHTRRGKHARDRARHGSTHTTKTETETHKTTRPTKTQRKKSTRALQQRHR